MEVWWPMLQSISKYVSNFSSSHYSAADTCVAADIYFPLIDTQVERVHEVKDQLENWL